MAFNTEYFSILSITLPLRLIPAVSIIVYFFPNFSKFNYISALKKQGIGELFKSINEAHTAAYIKMGTPKLTRTLIEAVNRQPPQYKGNFRPKLRFAHQGGSNPPVIIIHGNSVENITKAYTKYLERSFRKVFNLVGTPLKIEYKNSSNNPFVKTSSLS